MSSSAHALDAHLSMQREQIETIAVGSDELTLARVRAAGGGDRRAQRWLVEAVLSDVRRVARSLSACSVEADDASQYAIIQVLRAAENFEGRAGIRHWARRVATLAVLKHNRRIRVRQVRECSGDPDCDGSRTPIAAPETFGESLPRSLREYLAELPSEQSEALVLKHALGYSVPEIAELTNASPNTVKSRLRLATKQLRRRIRQETLTGAPSGGPS